MHLISFKSFERADKCMPTAYHASHTCRHLKVPASEVIELTEGDLQRLKKYLRPCKACHEAQTTLITEIWPKAEQVIIWHCSDGRDFSSEVEALRYELDLFRKGRVCG